MPASNASLLDSRPDHDRAAIRSTRCILNRRLGSTRVILDPLDGRWWNRVYVEKRFSGVRREYAHIIDIDLGVAASRRALQPVHRVAATTSAASPSRARHRAFRPVPVDSDSGKLRDDFAELPIGIPLKIGPCKKCADAVRSSVFELQKLPVQFRASFHTDRIERYRNRDQREISGDSVGA